MEIEGKDDFFRREVAAGCLEPVKSRFVETVFGQMFLQKIR